MFNNYLKVTVRNLIKNQVYVSINIVGLGLALSCCIVAYLNSQFDWDFDKSHKKIDHIYHIHNLAERHGELREYGRVPFPMADAIRNDLAGATKVFRAAWEVARSVRELRSAYAFNAKGGGRGNVRVPSMASCGIGPLRTSRTITSAASGRPSA